MAFASTIGVPPPVPMNKDETLDMRQKLIPKACGLHFDRSPLKVTRAYMQYMYDDTGAEFLDCINCVAHVGHCNTNVVNAGKTYMATVGHITGKDHDVVREYISKLKTTLPSELDTILFTHSGSEANDLALQLARRYTNGHDVVAVKGSFFGSLSSTDEISSRYYYMETAGKSKVSDWVHMIPCPDSYRGSYKETDSEASNKFVLEGKKVINGAIEGGRKLACFISEPIMSAAGVIIPPAGWLASMYQEIRSHGGVAIADETQSGVGRTGSAWWGFQYHNVLPDIVSVGKPLGNGYPMAAVVTKKAIAEKLGPYELQRYTCDPISASIGLAVINTLRSDNLLKNARDVGVFLREGLKSLAADHPNIGNVRGVGLMLGVEIVVSRQCRKPYRYLAEQICYKMKEKHIIIANDGNHRNVLIIVPPMCFTCENAHRVITTLSKVLIDLEEEVEKSKDAADALQEADRSLISLGVLDEVAKVAPRDEMITSAATYNFLALD